MSAPHYFHAHETARMDELEGVPLAGFRQRGIGFSVDFGIVLLLWAPVEWTWRHLFAHGAIPHQHGYHFDLHGGRSLLVAMVYFVMCNYFTNGKSLGKWLARSRVVSLTHPHLGLWQCVERVLGYGVSTAEGIGFLQYFYARNRMCVHDRIAETIVVDTRR